VWACIAILELKSNTPTLLCSTSERVYLESIENIKKFGERPMKVAHHQNKKNIELWGAPTI
jgi:hypothetical protein